jgi:hypothetical protein
MGVVVPAGVRPQEKAKAAQMTALVAGRTYHLMQRE